MRFLNSTDERGSGTVEFVVWLALVALPLLWLVSAAVKFESALSASQQIGREVAREASLGLDYQANLATLASDLGLPPTAVAIQVDCGKVVAGGCVLVRASVQVAPAPAVRVTLPVQSAALQTALQ